MNYVYRHVSIYRYSSCRASGQREVSQREAARGMAWHTIVLLYREDFGMSLLLCPDKMNRERKLKCPLLAMAYALMQCYLIMYLKVKTYF
jgi:hypothetical protein